MITIDWQCEFPDANREAVKEISEKLLKAWEKHYSAGGGRGFYASQVASLTRKFWEAIGKPLPEDFSDAKSIAADIAEEVVNYGFGE